VLAHSVQVLTALPSLQMQYGTLACFPSMFHDLVADDYQEAVQQPAAQPFMPANSLPATMLA
jgi:hypothetical protein